MIYASLNEFLYTLTRIYKWTPSNIGDTKNGGCSLTSTSVKPFSSITITVYLCNITMSKPKSTRRNTHSDIGRKCIRYDSRSIHWYHSRYHTQNGGQTWRCNYSRNFNPRGTRCHTCSRRLYKCVQIPKILSIVIVCVVKAAHTLEI
jgi:hypothetical protein